MQRIGQHVASIGCTCADVVFIESPSGDTYENESDVDLYNDVLADVVDRALDPDAPQEIVHRYEFQHAPPGGRPR